MKDMTVGDDAAWIENPGLSQRKRHQQFALIVASTCSILVAAIALAVDDNVFGMFTVPKHYTLILLAHALSVAVIVAALVSKEGIVLSVIDGLLLARIVWAASTNLGMITHPSNLQFWISLSLILTSILARQSHAIASSNGLYEAGNGRPAKASIAVLVLTLIIIGLVQLLVGVAQLAVFDPDAFGSEYNRTFATPPSERSG